MEALLINAAKVQIREDVWRTKSCMERTPVQLFSVGVGRSCLGAVEHSPPEGRIWAQMDGNGCSPAPNAPQNPAEAFDPHVSGHLPKRAAPGPGLWQNWTHRTGEKPLTQEPQEPLVMLRERQLLISAIF